MNGTEQNEAKRHYVQKKEIFSVFILFTAHFEPPMNRKYTETLAVVDNILQRVYRLVQYLAIVNRMPQN